MNRLDDLLTCLQSLKKDQHENLESIRRKTPEELKINLELNASITADNALIDSIITVFEIFEQKH